jgi:hypothetical protein
MRVVSRVLLSALMMFALLAGPAPAGEAEMTLLRSYIGSWAGSGVLVGGDEPEKFTCRLKVSKGQKEKVNYAGRCSLVNMNLSVTGTIIFNDKADRYEATMRSNVGFSAAAIGSKKGKTITFVLNEKQKDRGGNQMDIGSVLKLDAKGITVDFNVEFNRSGQVLTTTVPFRQQ